MAYHNYQWVLNKTRGLNKKVKLLLYKQIIRPTMTYAFPVWAFISSHQMERIRIFERKILSHCLGLRRQLTEQGYYKCPSLEKIYKLSGIERFDRFAIRTAINCLKKCTTHSNNMIKNLNLSSEEFNRIKENKQYLPAMSLLHLADNGGLHDPAGKLIFYHRRYKSLNLTDLVYKTNQ